jgi:glycosyltransferase involved in cell wall biosynthesis
MSLNIQFLKSHLVLPTGYGEHARNFAGALVRSGFQVDLYNDVEGRLEYPGLAELRQIEKPNPLAPLIYVCFHHNLYVIPGGQLAVVRTMFETDRLHPRWKQKVDRADAVWVPSQFNADTFSRSGISADKLFVVRDPLDTEMVFSPGYVFKNRKRFKFLSIFNGIIWYRKGADVLLQAYFRAFSAKDDVCLVVKTDKSLEQLLALAGLRQGALDPEVEVIRERLSDKEMLSLYSGTDAYVLPSRGEGIGRPYLYAMLKGMPVIATGWSGNREFMNPDNSFLVNYRLKKIPGDLDKMVYPLNEGYCYAEPDADHAAELMRRVYDRPGDAGEKVLLARQEVETHHSYAAVAEQTCRALARLKPSGARRSLLPQDIYLNMYPLFFPGANGDLKDLDREFSKKPLKAIAIYGTGAGGRLAYQWVSRFEEIETIVFLDREIKSDTYLDCPVLDFKCFDLTSVDVILVATATFFVTPILANLEKVSPVPVYFFGA